MGVVLGHAAGAAVAMAAEAGRAVQDVDVDALQGLLVAGGNIIAVYRSDAGVHGRGNMRRRLRLVDI